MPKLAQSQEPEIPAPDTNWRQRIMETLSHPEIGMPPHRPAWLVLLKYYATTFLFAPIFLPICAIPGALIAALFFLACDIARQYLQSDVFEVALCQ